VCAGVLAGTVGSAGGITSLISYPALLAVGIPPLPANVTNAVALVANLPGSAAGSRLELRGQGPWLRRQAPLAALGGVCGATLLLVTPAGTFQRVVPFLLALASALLFFQPQISAWRAAHFTRGDRFLWPAALFAVALYDGYFGAGSGVMALTLFLLTVDQSVARANALKNVILGVSDICATVIFVVFGSIHWIAAASLALGVLVGSYVGPSLTRRVPGSIIRYLAACCGLGLAVRLWIVPG